MAQDAATNALVITPERVREAATKCSQAHETLKTLFPEVFVESERKLQHGDISELLTPGQNKDSNERVRYITVSRAALEYALRVSPSATLFQVQPTL